MKVAICTGVEGQDGKFLSEHLLGLGYKVIGVTRRKSTSAKPSKSLDNFIGNNSFKLVFGDITDPIFIQDLVQWYRPDYYFNLAAMSHVGHSFIEPVLTFDTNATAVIIALEAIRRYAPKARFYQASTSELYGTTPCPETGFTEDSPFHPRSPYGVAKLAAYHAVINYREAYEIFACNGILFNHSSPNRGFDFATRKITEGVARIRHGYLDKLRMGNMSAVRDEGHAADYVKAMHLILDQDAPDDFIVATGDAASIEDMLRYVCSLAELNYDDVYEMDERFMRPSDIPWLQGNPAKIKALGWEPEYDWKALLKEMYEHDLKETRQGFVKFGEAND
jgi:GDPmannose 4,6-dehydratase